MDGWLCTCTAVAFVYFTNLLSPHALLCLLNLENKQMMMLRERLCAISDTGNNVQSQWNVAEGHDTIEKTTISSTDLTNRAVESSSKEEPLNAAVKKKNTENEECENGMMPLHSPLSLKGGDDDDQAPPPIYTPVAVARAAEVSQRSAGTCIASTSEDGNDSVSQPFATVSSGALPHVGVDSRSKQVERRPCIGAVLVSVNGVRIQVGRRTYTWRVL